MAAISRDNTTVTFITWYPSCRRSDALAEALGGTSHLIHFFKFKQPLYAPFKYIVQTLVTWYRLFQDRPDIVLVASPPVFAALAVWSYCKVTGRRYVIDAHTGVFDDDRWRWSLPVSRFLARGAIATLVTNRHLAREVERWRGRAAVIGDVPVSFPHSTAMELDPGFHVMVINTFSQDEPLDEVLLAAQQLPEVIFHITGNLQHSRKSWQQSVANNVRFTGWLSEEKYAGLLQASDAVICLTTHDHTMQRGAYEAMAMAKPLITSDWALLRDTFSEGTVHVDNSAAAIIQAVKQVARNKTELSISMRQLADQRKDLFQAKLQDLREAFVE